MISSAETVRFTRIPGPPLRRMFPILLELRRDLLQFSIDIQENYGEFVAFRMGLKRAFMVSHPQHFRHVLFENPMNYRKGLGLSDASPLFGKGLLTSEGEIWNTSRRALQAAFQKKELERYAEIIVRSALSMLDRWRQNPGDQNVTNVAVELTLLTLEILGRTLLRHDFGSQTAEVADDLRTVISWAILHLKAILPLPLVWPTPANRSASRALKRLDALVARMLQTEMQLIGDPAPTLFGLLLAQLGPKLSSVKLTQVRDEIMTFLLVGHETTAALMCWTIFLVTRHPEVRERVESELEGVLRSSPPRFEDLPLLTYTRAVLEESARLYPPVWMLPRKAIAKDKIGSFEIPANSEVLLNVYSLHRHPEFWIEPEVFNPSRFIPHGLAGEALAAYMPFGAGPRTCIGSRFGMMEATLVLATVFQACRLELLSVPRPDAGLTLRPQGGLYVRFLSRPHRPESMIGEFAAVIR